MRAAPWLLGGGALALLLLTSSTAQAAVGIGGGFVLPYEARLAAVRRVALNEGAGSLTAINRNTDGAGVSIGLVQWSQRGGGLIELLRVWRDRERARLISHLGPSWVRVLETAARKSLDPVDGAPLWAEPWLGRWRAALADPALQVLQLETAANGSHMVAAESAFRTLGARSVRALTLIYDRSIQQGGSRVRRVAAQVQAEIPDASEREKLERLVDVLEPLAGRWAYTVRARSRGILDDPKLSDADAAGGVA